MPMSPQFTERLSPKRLKKIVDAFGTPFHLYDEQGILDTGERLKKAFKFDQGFREFYAVKALPNPEILKLMHQMGFGFDCSSIIELQLAHEAGARPEQIMFTSNNTSQEEFREAQKEGGCILNLDDITLIDKVPSPFPDLICFRLNPGNEREGNAIIGKPEEAKYGITYDQLIPAYAAAQKRGAKRFGLHTMICSNERNYLYMVETVNMLLKAALTLKEKLGICVEFINMGGGIGIPYHPTEHTLFDIEAMAEGIEKLLSVFKGLNNWEPSLYMESGRFMTGPHGVLVTRAINHKHIYEKFVGVDSGMPALMRHAMYGSYHHATVCDKDGTPRPLNAEKEVISIVGSICENIDRLATRRELPLITVNEVDGDLILIHDTGAHGIAMGFNYNGRTRPQEIMLRSNGTAELIRRAETIQDLRATLNFEKKAVSL